MKSLTKSFAPSSFARLVVFALLTTLGCSGAKRWQVRDPDERKPEVVAAAEERRSPEWNGVAGQPEPMTVGSSGVGPSFLEWSRSNDATVAKIGGDELKKSQVYDYLLASQPNRVKAAIAVMLGNRVIASECDKFGIRVGDEEIEAWYRQHVEQVRARAMLDYGPQTTFEKWVELTQGQTPARYERAAKDRERATRLLARLIRYREALEDRVELRIISLTQRDVAADIRAQIEKGADFEILARQYSVHPSAERGGLMQPVWRRALNASLEGPAFALQEGEVSSVIVAKDDLGLDRFQIIKVVRRWLGRRVSYAEIERDILAGLQQQPIAEDEFLMWQLEVNRLAEVRDS